MLQAVSLVVSLAVLLWTLGLPSLNVALADNITLVSDTLSDSDLSALSNHEISFVTPTGVLNGETIVITFPVGFNLSTSTVDFTDIDVASTTDFTLAANCAGSEHIGAGIVGQDLTLTFCPSDGGYLSAGGTTTIQIGTNATSQTVGDQQITNHPSAGSYDVDITAGVDSGSTIIVILDDVQVTASVDTVFNFTVSGFTSELGVNVNGTTTNATTTSIAIPFGTLTANNIKTAAQRLNVTTNAVNGFVVTVQQSTDLQSTTGADIDSFANGSYLNTPGTWAANPLTNNLNDENTWGHWGITSSDDLNGDEFGTNLWVAASTTPREVFAATSSADGTTANVGSTTVGYQVEISSLQEAADDYETFITYVATPTF
jgi:hypothetical protein